MNKSSRKQRQVVVATWRKISLRLLLYATLLYCSFAQNCSKDLENTVVYEGNATLFPRASNGDKVKWQVAPSSAASADNLPYDLTDYDNKVVSPFDTPPNLYAANSSGLTISNANGAPQGGANYSTAGMYTLNYQDPPNCVTAAGLVVIIRGPVCSVDTSNPTGVVLTCSVLYASYRNQQINPIMTWKDSSGTVMTEDQPDRTPLYDESVNPGVQNATSKYSVGSADTNTYECQMTFSAPPPELPDFIAKNAPNYKQSCFAQYVMETTTAVPTTTSAYDTSTTTQSTTETITTTAATTTTTTTSMAATTTTTALASSSSSPSTVSPDSPLTVSPILSSSSSASSANPASATSSTSSPGPSPISPSPPSSSVPPVQVPTYPMEPTPASTTISAALGSNAETQALAMVLSLSLASVLLAGVVCGCWYFCCCPNPVGAKKGLPPERRRRKFQGTFFERFNPFTDAP